MADRDGPSFDRWSEVGDLLAVDGGWNMHRCGGVKMYHGLGGSLSP